MRIFYTIFFLVVIQFAQAAQVNVRLVIRKGLLELADGEKLDYYVFTDSSSFTKNSSLLKYEVGDEVTFNIINGDTRSHGFAIDHYGSLGTIVPGDSISQVISLTKAGVFKYYDPINTPWNAHSGLSGTLHIREIGDLKTYFYWDLREHQFEWSPLIEQGTFPDSNLYEPTYFSINGNFDPYINADSIARIRGKVDVEFGLIIVNHGLAIHSMHFHGYHLTVEKNSKNKQYIGRSKDTFPLYPYHILELSCTPDKPGEYPVHDHNLVAVTGGGIYHAGMFTTLLIDP
jgi:hypothetical protein